MLEDTHCVCLLCSHIFSVISLDATYKTPFPRNNYWYEVFERVTAEPVIKQGVLLSVRSAVMVQVCKSTVLALLSYHSILDSKTRPKDQMGILCSLTL